MWHFNYFARNTLLVVKLGKFKHHICENNYLFTNNYLLLSISTTTTQVRTSSQYTIEHACHLKPAHAHYNQIATAHASMTSPKHTTAHARNNVQYVLDLIQYVIALQAAARTSWSHRATGCSEDFLERGAGDRRSCADMTIFDRQTRDNSSIVSET